MTRSEEFRELCLKWSAATTKEEADRLAKKIDCILAWSSHVSRAELCKAIEDLDLPIGFKHTASGVKLDRSRHPLFGGEDKQKGERKEETYV